MTFFGGLSPSPGSAGAAELCKSLSKNELGVCFFLLLTFELNPYSARQMETHHRIIEWALANAIDTKKFNTMILPSLARAHPDREDYKTPFTEQQVRDWVDHDGDNLWVLCDVHHRAPLIGIHSITFPIWGPQNLLGDDFQSYVRDQLRKVRGDTGTKKKSKSIVKRRGSARKPAQRKGRTTRGKATRSKR